MKLIKEMLELIDAQKEYIMALPADVVAKLPTMPGFDGDWADDVVHKAQQVIKLTEDKECAICGEGKAVVQVTRYCDTCSSDFAGVGEYLAGKLITK